MQIRGLLSPRGLAGLAVVGLAVGSILLAQEAEQQPRTFGDTVQVGWVLVPVTVQTPEGFVTGLEEARFRLSVDDRPQPIGSFEHDVRAPVRLVFLQDLSGSMGTMGRLERSAAAIHFFLLRSRPGDRFALGTFAGSKTHVEVPLTSEVQTLREAVAAWEAWGTTALHDAIAWIPEISGGDGAVKPAAVLVTDGVDNASTLSAAAAREAVRRAQIPVFSIGLDSGDAGRRAEGAESLYRVADALGLLAGVTGGEYFAVGSEEPIVTACAAILNQLRHQYVLGFQTSGSGEEAWRRIQVQIEGAEEGWRIQHRQGYTGSAPLL